MENAATTGGPLGRVRIVLVAPLYSGNIGAVCRAMANAGLADLALVNPRPIDEDEARMMACHAGHVLAARRTFPDLPAAVADCVAVYGTTARKGLYRQHARPPRACAPDLLADAGRGPVALVFGREDNGLDNTELAVCTHLVQIPSHPDCPSLNLAQAVMVCAYELFLAADQATPPAEKSAEASTALRERMFGLWRQVLLAIGFMKEDMAEHMMLGLRRILARGVRTEDDARILMGIARQTAWAAAHPRPAPELVVEAPTRPPVSLPNELRGADPAATAEDQRCAPNA